MKRETPRVGSVVAFISDLDDKTLGGNFNGPRTGDELFAVKLGRPGKGAFALRSSLFGFRQVPFCFLKDAGRRRAEVCRGGGLGKSAGPAGRALPPGGRGLRTG